MVYVLVAFQWYPDAYDENDTIKVIYQVGVPGVGYVDDSAETTTLEGLGATVEAGLDELFPSNITPT